MNTSPVPPTKPCAPNESTWLGESLRTFARALLGRGARKPTPVTSLLPVVQRIATISSTGINVRAVGKHVALKLTPSIAARATKTVLVQPATLARTDAGVSPPVRRPGLAENHWKATTRIVITTKPSND